MSTASARRLLIGNALHTWISVLICTVLLGAAALSGCTPVAGLTVGALLDNLKRSVDDTIQGASAEFRGVITQTGSTVMGVVDRATYSFEDSLGNSIDRLDAAAAGRLQQVESIVNDFTTDAARMTTDIQQRAQTLALTLPLSNGQPQVQKWSPHFVNPSGAATVVVDGIFTQAQRQGHEPTLALGSTTYRPAGNTTQQLIFAIPGKAFGASAPNSVTTVSATLTVPYHSNLLKSDKTARYTLIFGVLPASPGTFVVQRKTYDTVREERVMRTETYHQFGGEDRPARNRYCTFDLPSEGGWRIKPFADENQLFRLDTSAADENNPRDDRKEGRRWTKKILDAGNAYKQCVEVWTDGWTNGVLGIGGHHSGDISFHLEWTIERTVEVEQTVTDPPLELQWGERRDLPLKPGQWSLTYQPFQGAPAQVSGPYQSDWFTVAVGASTVNLSTLPTDQVKF